MQQADQDRLEQILGYRFKDVNLLELAITHASLADRRLESNERMEFLGDAILGMVVCDFLFRNFTDLLEGELTKIKSTVVSRRTCAEVAHEMHLADLVRLGKGMSNRRTLPGSVVAATFEALIGAVFLDGGLEVKDINIGKFLKQDRLAFHHRFAGQRPDITQSQHSCSVADDRDQVTA